MFWEKIWFQKKKGKFLAENVNFETASSFKGKKAASERMVA
jgi:hypothetical protein